VLKLRPYQQQGCEQTLLAFESLDKLVAVAPTGSGKTVYAASLIEHAVKHGQRALFLAHRKELIDQTSKMLDFIGLQHGVMMGDHHRHRPEARVQVASVQSLMSQRACVSCRNLPELMETCQLCDGSGRQRSRKLPEADFIVVDEAHRVLGDQYVALLKHYPHAKVLAITATPWRLDGKGLAAMFSKMIVLANMAELIDQGFLLPLRIFRPPQAIDLSAVRMTRGDYDNHQLGGVMRNTTLIGNIVDHYKQLASNERAVVFCTNVLHSEDVTRRFVEAGIAAEHLDGSMPKGKREAILARLSDGTTKVVCNCDVLCEGWDLPSLHCVILARPTKSITRYLQQVGRAMRTFEGQQYALILDHANCTREHGRPENFRRWTLEDRTGKERGKRTAGDPEPTSCPECGLLDQKPGQCERCDGLQLFGPQVLQILETNDQLVEDTSEIGESEIHQPEAFSGVLCSRCRKNFVFVPGAKHGRVKVTCSRCLGKAARERTAARN